MIVQDPLLTLPHAVAGVLPWLNAFTVSVSVLTLALFAHLAAVYVAWESSDAELKDHFRERAMHAAVCIFIAGTLTIVFARGNAPLVYEGLTSGHVALGMHVVTAVAGLGGLWALWRRRWLAAVTAAAAAQASFLVWGWAWSQFPWMMPPRTPSPSWPRRASRSSSYWACSVWAR